MSEPTEKPEIDVAKLADIYIDLWITFVKQNTGRTPSLETQQAIKTVYYSAASSALGLVLNQIGVNPIGECVLNISRARDQAMMLLVSYSSTGMQNIKES